MGNTDTVSLVVSVSTTRHGELESYTNTTNNNTVTMDQIVTALEPLKQFSKDSVRLVKRCTKPDRKEFQKIAIATAIGFALMGFIGFFCEAHPHPYQQHHRGSLEEIFRSLYRYFICSLVVRMFGKCSNKTVEASLVA